MSYDYLQVIVFPKRKKKIGQSRVSIFFFFCTEYKVDHLMKPRIGETYSTNEEDGNCISFIKKC